MKYTTLPAAVLAVALSAGIAFAQQGSAAAPAAQPVKQAAKAKMSRYSGSVEAVDAAAGKLSVKDSKGTVKEFAVSGDVKVKKGGKAVALADVKTGEKVSVSYEGSMDSPQVKGVMVMAAKKKSAAKTSKQ